ncbi:MAG: ABC transporter substrate-binding protein [Syntrophorhabdales bacterium]|jgi:NitT/TauT family transport system substrate-binding protein
MTRALKAVLASLLILLPASVNWASADNPEKVRIGYNGSACEAALFTAYHKGFFKDVGIEAELVKMDFESLKEGLATGKIDATQGNFKWIKPIEQGLNVRLVAGIHNGCIQLVVPGASSVRSIGDLKGKTIGVEAIGGGPMILLAIELRKLGIDFKKDVSWKAYPGPQMQQAVEKGEIDAIGIWDSWGEIAIEKSGYRRIFSSSIDKPYKDLYCCFLGLRTDFITKKPELAKKLVEAWLRGVESVARNPEEAAKIEVDHKYTGGNITLVTKLLKSYRWEPGVKRAGQDLKLYIKEQKAQGILLSTTDENAFYTRVFAQVIPSYKGK